MSFRVRAMCFLGLHDWIFPSRHGSKPPHCWCRHCFHVRWLR